MASTYKDLFTLVNDQIKKSSQYQTTKQFQNQLDRTDIAPATSNPSSDVRSMQIVNSIQELLKRALPGFIIEGLEVTATDPESSSIIIKAGRGSKGGVLFELNEDTTVPIPFNNEIETFFVMLYKDRILIDKDQKESALTIAKIIVPDPSRTFVIAGGSRIFNRKEDRQDELQSYIVGFKEYKLYGDANGNLEEDSVDLMRNNIGAILADNIIGNIRLSEDLKITNSQGTLELDSRSMLLYNSSGNITAKFNKDGTFYYNSDGVEIAKFGADSARIGNILITTNAIQSGNFVSENQGFQIKDDGYAEFENVRIRGRISSSVFESDKISAVGGKLFVGKSSVIAHSMTTLDSSALSLEDSSFVVGDILRIKDGINEEYMEVTDASLAPIYSVNRDIANQYSANNNPNWQTGTAIVSTGNYLSGQNAGFIMMDAVSEHSPFIDIASRASSTYNDWDVKTRLGNLEGISDLDFGGSLTGYGLYADNVYLKGCLFAPTIKTALSGSRLELDTNALAGYDSGDNRIFNLCLSGAEVGDVCIGNFAGLSGAMWDASTATFCLRADLNADDIVAGSLSADRIGAGHIYTCQGITIATQPEDISGSGFSGRTEFTPTSLISYDSNSNIAWCVRDGHMQATDIRLQDPACTCCYSFLNAGKLQFHDELGQVPYVNRICSGQANTGDYICLLGWKNQPEVITSIKSLNSYSAAKVAQDQKWSVYADNYTFYCNSITDYGYCFQVHASLDLAVGTGSECLKNATFGTAVCTDLLVCSTKVRSKFQLWCNNIAPSNYYYGTLCYAICYRCLGCGVWCACCFCYAHPHSSALEITTDGEQTQTINFPCNAQWEIMLCEVSLGWTDSGICATGSFICCVCVSTAPSPSTCLLCCTGCCFAVNNTGHSQFISACGNYAAGCDGSWTKYYDTGETDSFSGFVCACAVFGTIGTPYCARIQFSNLIAYECNSCCTFICCNGSGTDGCQLVICGYNNNASTYTMFWAWCINITYNTQVRCYCKSFSCGAAQCCVMHCAHSLCDTYGTHCVLDPSGVLNWMAISYS